MKIEELLAYAKSKGFFWPTAEIYGGASGLFDYGHLGTLLKRRFENLWISFFIDPNEDYHLIEGATMLPEKALIASGHTTRFNDVSVGCTKCQTYFRADKLLSDRGIAISEGATAKEIGESLRKNGIKCPKCGGVLGEPKAFNMMMDVALGPERKEKGYLRPETAQSAYLNFFQEYNTLRKTLPFGLAIIGRAYRNEISPRQGLYRMRELVQAELQIFFDPEGWKPESGKLMERTINVVTYSDKKAQQISAAGLSEKYSIPAFYAYHMALMDSFYTDILGVPKERFRFLEKGGDEKAFYNKVHMDLEVDIESWGGFNEVGGLHYRGDYDLQSHSKGSNQDLSVISDGKKIIPSVLELSFGVDRNIWMLLDMFYTKEQERSILKIPKFLAPYQIAVFPLQKDEKINEVAERIRKELSGKFKVVSDSAGSIGRRYARMDDVGTPYCITVDFDTIEKSTEGYNSVTVRDRDDKTQKRVDLEELSNFFETAFSAPPRPKE
ncbi:glycine--tRNA ligase [Candidatus Marsarchaeota archaeon]|jgi:glycyl-tRNA synthetase|nr:glycine--tRNA ligase [Candidatus Marsarchaeota archaeon]